jgi:sulfate transport system ATP-binding protein
MQRERVATLRDAVTLANVTKAFGETLAVADVSASVTSGELLALLGPSGCGKTTLLRTIAGLERPDYGRILMDGSDVTQAGIASRNIGFVFQNYALFPHLDVFENVAFGLRRKRFPAALVRDRVGEMLELVGLAGYERRHTSQLSGGQRQRVAFARALAVEPRLLLLDEPFAALDVHIRRDLRTWLRALHDRTHVTTILVTHDYDEAMDIADAIVLMRDGKIVQRGAPREVYDSPQDLFAMQFLGDVTVWPSRDDGPSYLRPHHVRVAAAPFPASLAGTIQHVSHRGPLLRLEVRLRSGHDITADLSTAGFFPGAFATGAIVHLAPTTSVSFADAQAARVS